ncbi:MAG: hypothetical protein DHS20C06_07950 [Hyphobacterium sp.]|nr:MAG: hypothetical protein DHS20C06_07950 [Hyphobacterium sp.]
MGLFKRLRQQKRRKTRLQRLRALTTAGILTATGAVLTFTPLPFGAPVLAGGIALFSTVDRTFRRAVMRARQRSRLLNTILGKAGSVLPARATKIIGLTDPRTYEREANSPDHLK